MNSASTISQLLLLMSFLLADAIVLAASAAFAINSL